MSRQIFGLTTEQYEQLCLIWNLAKALAFLIELSPEKLDEMAHLFKPVDIYELQRWAREMQPAKLDREVWAV